MDKKIKGKRDEYRKYLDNSGFTEEAYNDFITELCWLLKKNEMIFNSLEGDKRQAKVLFYSRNLNN